MPRSCPVLRPAGGAPRRTLALAVCGIAALILASCGGDDAESASAQRPLSATAERIREDGFATLSSRIAVEFDGELHLALDGRELIEAVSLRSAAGPGPFRPANILVRSVAVSKADGRTLIVETPDLVGNGAELRIRREALAKGGEGSVAVRVTADLSPTEVPFASLPLVPTNPDLFSTGATAVVTPSDRDNAAMRKALAEHLDVRGSAGETSTRALKAYDETPASVTSPKLAAALAALVGTFAEDALADLFTSSNCTGQPVARIAFETPPGSPALAARVTYTDSGARIISVNPAFEGEAFQLLAPILAHESIHCDRADSLTEEVAATAFDAFLFMHFLAAEPELAASSSRLARNYAIDALALLNSGLVVPETVGVLPSPGDFPVLQGSDAPYRSFAQYVVAAYNEITDVGSPTEPLAVAYAGALAGIVGAQPQDPFDLEYLDALLGLTLPLEVRDVAVDALGLAFTP